MTRPIVVMCSLALLTACPLDPKNIGSPEEDTTTDPGTSEPSTSDPSTSAPVDPTSEGGETAPSTGDDVNTSGVTETGDPTTGLETDSDSESGDPMPACGAMDPAAVADFVMTLEGWPHGVDDDFAYDVNCTIDAVDSDDTTVTTTVTCDVEGSPLVGSFALPAAAEGEVDWAAGQSVFMHVFVEEDEFATRMELRVSLDGDPEALLVDADRWAGDGVPEVAYMIGPILREVADTCVSGEEDESFVLRYSLLSGANVSILSGQRGALEIDPTHAFAIDVQYSENGCCHGRERILIRRVKTG